MKLVVELEETSSALNKEYSGDVATMEKKSTLEYRSMHSAYHITASMEWLHSGSVDNFSVAFPTHCLHRRKGMSPLHMNKPYTLLFPPRIVVLENNLAEALEVKEEKRVIMFF